MSSRAVLQVVANAIVAARYDDVLRALQESTDEFGLSPGEVEEALRLTGWCRRLWSDRQQLQHVAGDLELDEQAVREQLIDLLGAGPLVETERHAELSAPPSIPPLEPAEPEDPPRLSLWVLGRFRVAVDGELIVGAEDDRSTPVLRFLACTEPGGVHKERLADRFWPDASSRVARRNLHQSIYTIRRLLGRFEAEDELVFANDHYRLGRDRVWRDTDQLADHVEQGRRARSSGQDRLALAHFRHADLLYGGELLADHPYDEWAYPLREHHRLLHREAAGTLLDLHVEAGDHLSIVQLAKRLLDLDPADEDACRRLMSAHAAGGQPHLSAMAFAALSDYLRDNHGLAPSAETVELAGTLTERQARR